MNSMIEFLMQKDALIAAVILISTVLILFYRVVKGPYTVDRLLSACCIQILIGLVALLSGCYESKAVFADFGLAIILFGFIQSILVSKFLEGKS